MPRSDQDRPGLTLAEAVRRAADALREAGLEDPAAEARWLVAAAAAVAPVDLVVSAKKRLDPGTLARIDAFLDRRSAREPLSRIVGRREFYGRDFLLSEGTLDPRADTEVLVDLVLDICAAPHWRGRPVEILDVGTGTGAILLTLLAEIADARGTGIDISADAISTARLNAERLGVADRATLTMFDLRAGLAALEPGRAFDFIVSNPPYIASADIPHLQPEVRCHDPHAALDGGSDGLDFYRLLSATLPRLSPHGWLVVEVGAGQAAQVAALMAAAAPGADVRTARDLAGHTRVVAVQPRPNRSDE